MLKSSSPSALPGPQFLPNLQNGPLRPKHNGVGGGWQSAGDHSPGQPQEACVGTQKSTHSPKGLDSFGFSAANCQPGLSYCSVPTWPCFPGLRRMVGNFHQPEAEGSLESVWRLPLSTPVTNHRLPLELPPRSFWEMVPPCPEYFTMAFQRENLLCVPV